MSPMAAWDRVRLWHAALLFGCGLAASASAADLRLEAFEPGALDGTSWPPFRTADTGLAFPTCVALQPDGKMLIGGFLPAFTNQNLVRLNPDGTVDASFSGQREVVGDNVRTVVVQPDGKILFGWPLRRLNPDSSPDQAFNERVKPANIVASALVLQPDGRIVAGGLIDGPSIYNREIGRWRCKAVVRVNPDGTLDESFTPAYAEFYYDGTGPKGPVDLLSMALQADGKTIIGGAFSHVNGKELQVARLNADGTLDETYPATPMVVEWPGIYQVLLQKDGRAVLRGDLRIQPSGPSVQLCRLDPGGVWDSTFDPEPRRAELYGQFAIQEDGKFVCAAHGYDGYHVLVRFNPNGSQDFSYRSVRVIGSQAPLLALQPDGRVVAVVGGRLSRDSESVLVWRHYGDFTIRLAGRPPTDCVVESSADLKAWETLGAIPRESPTLSVTDPRYPAGARTFYRARLPGP